VKVASRAIAAIVLGLIAVPVVWVILHGEPREFHIDAIEVQALVLPDRSMLVHERVTYRFTGADQSPFTVATRDWDRDLDRRWRITDVVARENGVVRATVASTPHLYEWDIAPATSGIRTYDLTYRVIEAVEVWSDTAELYWNWVGTNSPAVGQWTARVGLPRHHNGEVRAWAHGPLDGVLRLEPDAVVSAADRVPAGQFVDNRVLMPVEWFVGTPDPEARLDAILDEEARNALEANRLRERAERTETWRRRIRDVLTVLMGPLVVAAVAAFWRVWRRWGRDPARPGDIGDYWREVPDDPPAVGAALLAWRRVGSDAYAATVMDLARRGHLRIDEIQVHRRLRRPRLSYRFVATPRDESLLPFERRTLDWTFSGGAAEVTQDELVERGKAQPTTANSHWTSFQREVKEELDRRHYLTRGNGIAFVLHALIVVGLAILATVTIVLGAVVPGVIGMVAALVLAPLGILHRSRTPEGTRRDTEWRGLRRYLRDFSRLDEAPAGHLALWDQYLVAATALGVADELLDGLRQRFPEVAESAMDATSWYRSTPGRSPAVGIASFGRTFGSASVSSFSPPSSSSGSGGGFSSGGGGGGGGGGFGAR
jgi:uncharacterized membrane protein